VEDDEFIREQTQALFNNLFYSVDIAQDGEIALLKYKKHYETYEKNYDIIVSDIQMPNLDGIALTKEILKLNKEQKIIIISAHNDKKYLIDLINIGVDAFMQKPLSSENMLEVLYKVCSSFESKNIILLQNDYTYNFSLALLFFRNKKVELSENESKLLHLLLKNKNQHFTSIEIFNHLYFDELEKDFSTDSIKSLIKRLRKKTPQSLISNTQNLGYCANY